MAQGLSRRSPQATRRPDRFPEGPVSETDHAQVKCQARLFTLGA